MNTKKQVIYPKHQEILAEMGQQFTIEKGDASIALGAYFNVLRVMNLGNDFLKLTADDEFGKKLQDLNLLSK